MSERAASVLSALQEAPRPSKTKVARAMFPLALMGLSLSQSLVERRGFEFREELAAIAPWMACVLGWRNSDDWSFSASRGGQRTP